MSEIELQKERYRRKKLMQLNKRQAKINKLIEDAMETLRQLKRIGATETKEQKARRKAVLKSLKKKRLKINLEINKLNPVFKVGEEEIH